MAVAQSLPLSLFSHTHDNVSILQCQTPDSDNNEIICRYESDIHSQCGTTKTYNVPLIVPSIPPSSDAIQYFVHVSSLYTN